MNIARWICLFIQAPAWLPVRGRSSLCIDWGTQMEICRFPERVFQHPRSQGQLRTQLSGGEKWNTTPTHSFHFPLPHYKQMSPHLFSFFNHVRKVLFLFLTPPAVKSSHCQEADKQTRYRGANKKHSRGLETKSHPEVIGAKQNTASYFTSGSSSPSPGRAAVHFD